MHNRVIPCDKPVFPEHFCNIFLAGYNRPSKSVSALKGQIIFWRDSFPEYLVIIYLMNTAPTMSTQTPNQEFPKTRLWLEVKQMCRYIFQHD